MMPVASFAEKTEFRCPAVDVQGNLCGTLNATDAAFCANGSCGSRLGSCRACGAHNRGPANFCRFCGTPMPPLVNSDWLSIGGGSAHLSYCPAAIDLHNLKSAWDYMRDTISGPDGISGIAIVHGMVVATLRDGHLLTIDQIHGPDGPRGRSAEFYLDQSGICPPTANEDFVYVPTAAGFLHVFEVPSFRRVHLEQVGGELTGAVATQANDVAVADRQGRICGYHMSRGTTALRQTWEYSGVPHCPLGPVTAMMAADDKGVIAVDQKGIVHAVRWNGAPLWQMRIGQGADVIAYFTPILSAASVIVAAEGGLCASLDRETGVSRHWPDRLQEKFVCNDCALDPFRKVLYLPTQWNHVLKIDSETGATLGTFGDNSIPGRSACCPPLIAGNDIIFEANQSVYAYDTQSEQISLILRPGAKLAFAPIVSQGHLYLVTRRGAIHAWNEAH